MGADVMLVAMQLKRYSVPNNKGVKMKKEWKVCNVQTDHILDGEPESARCCAVALAMEEIIGRRSKYNGYSPVISNAKDMHLEHCDDEELPLSIDVYEEARREVDDFIWDFDATYGDETAPLPLPMRFRYRIINKKEIK